MAGTMFWSAVMHRRTPNPLSTAQRDGTVDDDLFSQLRTGQVTYPVEWREQIAADGATNRVEEQFVAQQ